MSEGDDPIREAVSALSASGYEVESIAGDHMLWLVDGQPLTEGELMALAVRVGLMDSTTTTLQ